MCIDPDGSARVLRVLLAAVKSGAVSHRTVSHSCRKVQSSFHDISMLVCMCERVCMSVCVCVYVQVRYVYVCVCECVCVCLLCRRFCFNAHVVGLGGPTHVHNACKVRLFLLVKSFHI